MVTVLRYKPYFDSCCKRESKEDRQALPFVRFFLPPPPTQISYVLGVFRVTFDCLSILIIFCSVSAYTETFPSCFKGK